MSISVFHNDRSKVWAYRYATTLEVIHQTGGIPNDPKVIQGWLKSRIAAPGQKQAIRDEELGQLVEKTLAERGITMDQATGKDIDAAIEEASINVNGFKRDAGGLVFEGRCVKSMLKEAFSVALAGGHLKPRGWGQTNKGLISFMAEHVQVPEETIPLFKEDGTRYEKADRVEQRFVSTFRGQGISYTDTLDRAIMSFTVECDVDLGDDTWSTVWLTAEALGIGAMRSQGSGKFIVVAWNRLP